MDCSAAPVQLYVGHKYICRIHGLTPYSSTGRCPYEIVKEGPLSSMFPRLTASSSQRSETTVVKHSVPKLRSKKIFSVGKEVIVYDNRIKLSASGKILEVLGNNTYLTDCGNGPQHISGDLISKVSEATDREIGGSNKVQPEIGDNNLDVDRDFFQDDDNVFIASESSIGSDFLLHLIMISMLMLAEEGVHNLIIWVQLMLICNALGQEKDELEFDNMIYSFFSN